MSNFIIQFVNLVICNVAVVVYLKSWQLCMLFEWGLPVVYTHMLRGIDCPLSSTSSKLMESAFFSMCNYGIILESRLIW